MRSGRADSVDDPEAVKQRVGSRHKAENQGRGDRKDYHNNVYVDFLSSASNLRVKNYKIEKIKRLRVKMVAGRIVPALASTTTAAYGNLTLETIKYIMQSKSWRSKSLRKCSGRQHEFSYWSI